MRHLLLLTIASCAADQVTAERCGRAVVAPSPLPAGPFALNCSGDLDQRLEDGSTYIVRAFMRVERTTDDGVSILAGVTGMQTRAVRYSPRDPTQTASVYFIPVYGADPEEQYDLTLLDAETAHVHAVIDGAFGDWEIPCRRE